MKQKILLNDLLRFDSNTIKKTKIKFNTADGIEDPLDVYLENPEILNSEWLFWRNKTRNFNVGQYAMNMVRINEHTWLLTTIKEVKTELNIQDGINYVGTEVEDYAKFYGRVIVRFHKKVMGNIFYMETVLDKLEVTEILPVTYDGDDFPGFNNISLSYAQLRNIIKRNKRDWVAALQNQKGIYLLMDKNNGKSYVRSATGENGMILRRWFDYIDNGHGDNKELKELVTEKGFDYVKNNFQFILLECHNSVTTRQFILSREKWWKDALLTREFGYNEN